jgi:hypothetical protein
MQKIVPIQPTRRFASPAAMAAALGSSRYPQRGLTCADWFIPKAGKAAQ